MVLAYHVVFGTYGFWLPNDPRGSWSQFVGSDELFRFGRATRVQTRASLAQAAHDRGARLAAKQALKYPPVVLTGIQAQSVGRGFGAAVHKCGYAIHACAILPTHVHLVLGRHGYEVEQRVRILKAAAATMLLQDGRHPLTQFVSAEGKRPSLWSRGLSRRYLNEPAAVGRAIAYVQDNPVKEGMRRQKWSFVTPFLG
jgi:REP element-mobilizing transposase RayT